MKIRRVLSAVVAAAVAIASLTISPGATVSVTPYPHIGATTEEGTWGVDLYDSAKGIDYGIDLSEVASVSFLFAANDIEQFEGHINGMIRTQFEGGDISYSSDDYIRYSLGYSFFYGVNDEYLGINTFGNVHDIYAETILPGYYTLTADVDNPIANGDADEVDKAAVYLQEGGADEISVVGAYIYDDEGNVLMTFDQYGTPVDYYYTLLEDTITEIRENLVAHESEFSVDFELATIPGGDIASFCMSLMEYAMDHTGVSIGGDYISCQYAQCGIGGESGYYHDGTNYVFHLEYYIDFFTTKQQEAEVSAKVDEIIESLDLDGKTDYEKICAIYEYVCDTTDYDYEALDTEDPVAHSAYATLCRNKSVCQGYAAAIYRLMLEAGIDCRIVIGTGNGEDHAWNIVELDGKYYYIDSTWDSNYEDPENYKYFLKGLDDFEEHDDQTMYYLYGYDMAETAYVPDTHVHTIVNHDAKAPTCTEIGWNAYETCSECVYTTYEEIAAKGHKFTEYVTTEEATCEAKGSATAECDNGCGKTDVKEIDALGHDYESGDNGCICKNCGKEVDFIYGDANSDGKVNNIDVLLMRKLIAGGWEVTVNEEALDVNCDGKVNNIDVLLLRKSIAGGWDVTLGPAA